MSELHCLRLTRSLCVAAVIFFTGCAADSLSDGAGLTFSTVGCLEDKCAEAYDECYASEECTQKADCVSECLTDAS